MQCTRRHPPGSRTPKHHAIIEGTLSTIRKDNKSLYLSIRIPHYKILCVRLLGATPTTPTHSTGLTVFQDFR